MNKDFFYVSNISIISPTPFTTPKDPYYEWLSDIYNVTVIEHKIPPKPVEETYYYYLDADGNAYFDSNNQLYVNERT